MTERQQGLTRVAEWLAVTGQPDAADAALSELERAGDPLSAARLRAKILAQARQYSGAIEQWQRVLAANPGDRDALAGIALAARLAKRPWLRAVVLPVAIVILLAAIAGGLIYFNRGPSEAAALQAKLDQQQAERQALDKAMAARLDSSLAALQKALDARMAAAQAETGKQDEERCQALQASLQKATDRLEAELVQARKDTTSSNAATLAAVRLLRRELGRKAQLNGNVGKKREHR